MGARGPAGKRTTERAGHRTKAELAATDHVSVKAPVTVPPALAGWSPAAKRWYRSLKESGQSQYFEPVDWEVARYVADLMTANPKPTASVFKEIWKAMADLGSTEGARRRMRIEIEREPEPSDEFNLPPLKVVSG